LYRCTDFLLYVGVLALGCESQFPLIPEFPQQGNEVFFCQDDT
jgi:hypothetical protein